MCTGVLQRLFRMGRLLDHHVGPSCRYPCPYSCHSPLMGPGAIPCPLKPIKSQMITLPFLKPLCSLSLCLNRNPKSLYSPVTRTPHAYSHVQTHARAHSPCLSLPRPCLDCPCLEWSSSRTLSGPTLNHYFSVSAPTTSP